MPMDVGFNCRIAVSSTGAFAVAVNHKYFSEQRRGGHARSNIRKRVWSHTREQHSRAQRDQHLGYQLERWQHHGHRAHWSDFRAVFGDC